MIDTDEDLEQTAREMVAAHGFRTLTFLHERAEEAEMLGDDPGAKAWRDIARVAEQLLALPAV